MTLSLNLKNNISFLKNRGAKVDDFEAEMSNLQLLAQMKEKMGVSK